MRVRNWREFQGYEKRGPRWIKLHLALRDNDDYLDLPLVARAVLPMLWIAAAVRGEDGHLPDDPKRLARATGLDVAEIRGALPALLASRFLERDESVAEPCDESVADAATQPSPQTETETEGEGEGETETEQGRAAPATASRPTTWTDGIVRAWAEATGGVLTHGRIGKTFKALVDRHGEELVVKAFGLYARDQAKRQSPSVRFFPEDFGKWRKLAAEPEPSYHKPLPPLRGPSDAEAKEVLAALGGAL